MVTHGRSDQLTLVTVTYEVNVETWSRYPCREEESQLPSWWPSLRWNHFQLLLFPIKKTNSFLFGGWVRLDYPVITRGTRLTANRPVCEYPLSSNHCLYQWSDIGEDRRCLLGLTRVTDNPSILEKRKMWKHFPENQRNRVIESETRAFYDVIRFDSIIDHANITLDPSTGHMLQTIQMI